MWVITVLILFGRAYSYHVGSQPLNWFGAQAYCLGLNSNLASIGSANENQEATSECLTGTNNGCWIGLSDRTHEGTFRYTDNSAATYMNWNAGEPNNEGPDDVGEDCVMLYDDGLWNDLYCTNIIYALYPLCNDPPAGPDCYDRGPCNDGYMDRTNGQWKYWGCGSGCAGGSYYTDGVCNCACIEVGGSCSEIPGYDNFNLYRYVPQLAFIHAIGIWGEYLSILLILILCILAVFCCKRKLKRKWGKIKKLSKYEGVSIVDNEMEDEIEKEPLNEYL